MAGEPKPAARRGAAKKGSKEYVRDDRDEMIDRAVASRRLLAPEQVAALSPAQQERYVAEHPGGGQKEVKVKVPAIGRIVHWYDDALVPAPGIIVRGSSQPRDTVRLIAFTAERGLTLTDAKYSEAPTANCWTWPPFVADVSEFIDLTEEEAAAQASAAATFDALRAGVGA